MPNEAFPSLNFKSDRLVHAAKARPSICITLLGISISRNPSHPSNAQSSMCVTVSGILIVSRL